MYIIEQFIKESNGAIPSVLSASINFNADKLCTLYLPKDSLVGPRHLSRTQKSIAINNPELKGFAEDFWPLVSRGEVFQPEPGCSEPTFVGGMLDTSHASNEIFNFLMKECLNKVDISFGKLLYCELGLLSQTRLKLIKDVSIGESIEEERNNYEVRISSTSLSQLDQEIKKGHEKRGEKIENGGLLFGEIDEFSKTIWLDYISGPPLDSEHSEKKFICGVKGTKKLENAIMRNSQDSSQFLGTWHTHPVSEGMPSRDDYQAACRLLHEKDSSRKNILFLIIGFSATSKNIRAHMFRRDELEPLLIETEEGECLEIIIKK